MYFNFLPAIKYDQKPISYPFSESDYVVAKNFFRRYKIGNTAFSQAVYFNKYAVEDGQRLDQISEIVYGNPNYDWIIVLTNNMVNTQYDLPMSENELRKHIESQYDNPYYDYHHYEIISDEEQMENFGKVLMPGGTIVDETFYNNRRVLTQDTFPDLSSNTKTLNYSDRYVFSSSGFDNSLVVDSKNARFEEYGNGTGVDSGFALYRPYRNGSRSNGYLRFRGINDNAEDRYAEFYQLDATYLTGFNFYGKFGNDLNGGEYPDLPDEILKLQYRTDPADDWTDIDLIIPLQMVQYFEFDGSPQLDLGFGGPGRPEGVYENVTLYTDQTTIFPSNARATVTVDSTGRVTDVTLTDRGRDVQTARENGSLYIRNEDIGNGFFYNAPEQGEDDKEYLPALYMYFVSLAGDPNGVQYGRYSDVPYQFSVPIPEEAKTPTTAFRLYQPDNTGYQMDQYAIQEVEYTYSQDITVGPDLDFIQIDNDNYVIEGIRWTRVDGVWYRVTEIGFRYQENGSTLEISGSDLSRPVTQFEYEQTENEKKREIYILKPDFLETLVNDFRKAALYKKSSDYVSNRLKKTGT